MEPHRDLPPGTHTTVTTREGGTGGIFFILGAVIVVLGIIVWFVSGGSVPDTATSPDVNVNVEGGTATAPAATEPATTDPAATAPATTTEPATTAQSTTTAPATTN